MCQVNIMPSSKYSTSSEDSQKLEKIIHPLVTSKANGNYADLAFIKTALSEATVVGLGEVTHGISECFQIKHRLLEFLVKEMDFSDRGNALLDLGN
jgi:erythromycin esterase-like protein